jgi:hypothetical protein
MTRVVARNPDICPAGHEVEEGTYHDAGAAHRGLDDGESDSDDGDELSDDDGEGGTRNLSDDAEEDWPATSWGEDDLLTPASTAAGLHRSGPSCSPLPVSPSFL